MDTASRKQVGDVRKEIRASRREADRPEVPPSHRRAFVTFLMFNDSYLPGCLMAAYGLLLQGSQSQRVCMVTSEVTEVARDALRLLYDEVLPVDTIGIPGHDRDFGSEAPKTGSARMKDAALTRFASLRLGSDGDFGTHYDRIINIDADLLPLRNFDSLWELSAPAGIINERREHMADFDSDGNLVARPGAMISGEWVWHDIYRSVCPPGSPIPRDITDRVKWDATNYGVNASLLLLEPSMAEYERFMQWVGSGEPNELARKHWPWTDQQAATLYWSGEWTSVDPSYSMFYGYPDVQLANGLHYAGIKPWSWRKRGFERRLHRFPDYTLWSKMFLELINEYPKLRHMGGMKKLERAILQVKSD